MNYYPVNYDKHTDFDACSWWRQDMHYWRFVRETTDNRWIPFTKGQLCGAFIFSLLFPLKGCFSAHSNAGAQIVDLLVFCDVIRWDCDVRCKIYALGLLGRKRGFQRFRQDSCSAHSCQPAPWLCYFYGYRQECCYRKCYSDTGTNMQVTCMDYMKMGRVGARNSWRTVHEVWNHPTVYSKKYAHGFVVLCFVVVMQSFIMNSHEVFIHIHQGCFAGTGAIVRLPQCQWSKPDRYGKISQCITTTKHSKAKTVCIFLGIYCRYRAHVTVHRLFANVFEFFVDVLDKHFADDIFECIFKPSPCLI